MKNTAEILFAGDLYLSEVVENEYLLGNGKNIFSGISDVLENCDFRVVNLESPLTNADSPIRKTGPNMKASPRMIGLIEDGGFNLANLANNHIKDYGEKGIVDTIEICNKAGIPTVGAGKDLNEAMKAFRVKLNNITISILNVCESEYQIAGTNSSGASPFDFYFTAQQIKDEKKSNDIVIVVYHGGNEHYNLPSPRLQKTFRFLIDMGADAVVGHHTHCYSGIEHYCGKPIFYSLGNFLFDDKTNFLPWYYGYMVTLKINKEGVQESTVYPYEQCKEAVKIELLKNEQLIEFNNNLEKLNQIISDEQLVEKEWNAYSNKMKFTLLNGFYPPCTPFKYIQKILKKLFGYKPLRKTKLSQLNYVRNEAHHELLVTVLNNYHKQ